MRRPGEGWRERLPGPAGSLGLHLAVLLAVLFGWQGPAPVEHPPIPVQIIFEPPPKPRPLPKPKPPPERRAAPRGPIASESFGDTNPKDLGPVNRDSLAPGRALLPLDAPKPALIPLTSTSPQFDSMLRSLEKPWLPSPARRPLPPRRTTMRLAKYPGTAATKDEYLAYITALARQHFDLLPLSLVGHRRGVTEISIIERSDGTIARMTVLKSSGYPDIDKRVKAIIAAVGRFPPIPQWYQKDSWDLTFILPFPGGLRE